MIKSILWCYAKIEKIGLGIFKFLMEPYLEPSEDIFFDKEHERRFYAQLYKAWKKISSQDHRKL